MKIGTEKRIGWLWLRHWENFAEAVEIKKSLVLRELDKMSQEIVFAAENLAQSFFCHAGLTAGRMPGDPASSYHPRPACPAFAGVPCWVNIRREARRMPDSPE